MQPIDTFYARVCVGRSICRTTQLARPGPVLLVYRRRAIQLHLRRRRRSTIALPWRAGVPSCVVRRRASILESHRALTVPASRCHGNGDAVVTSPCAADVPARAKVLVFRPGLK